MLALRDLLNPSRMTAIVDVGGADLQGNPPYQRMLDEGVCTAEMVQPVGREIFSHNPDLLKITTSAMPPHAALQALHAGKDKVAVQVQAEFFPAYTFGSLDRVLRELGLILHCFAEVDIIPIVSPQAVPHPDPHQIGRADLFYIRDFSRPMDVEQWKHLALLAHHVCGSYDLAMHAVSELAKAGAIPEDGAAQYRRILERL